MPFPVEYGGIGATELAIVMAIEELSRCCATTGLLLAVQKLGAMPIILAGTEAQKQKYFPPLASGEWLAAFGLTEAAAGSDVAANRMRARRDGDAYVLNGSKRFITHGSIANVLTVFALTDPDAGGRKGMSAFIVESETPGFSSPRLEHKLGIRGSPTAELSFRGVRVPDANRVGAVGHQVPSATPSWKARFKTALTEFWQSAAAISSAPAASTAKRPPSSPPSARSCGSSANAPPGRRKSRETSSDAVRRSTVSRADDWGCCESASRSPWWRAPPQGRRGRGLPGLARALPAVLSTSGATHPRLEAAGTCARVPRPAAEK